MGKRFKNYRFALKTLINPENGTASTAPANTALANFQEYASGAKKVTYTRDADSKPGELVKVAINPFALPLNASSLVKTFFSKRVQDTTTLNTVTTACNHSSADSVINELNGFIPAKAVVFVPGGDPPTVDPKSQITGVSYKVVPGASYTFPYGQATGELTESEVRANILTAVNTIARATVSFESENY